MCASGVLRLLPLLLCISACHAELPDDEVIQRWIEGIDNDLQHVFYEATGVAFLDSNLGISDNWVRGVDEVQVMNQIGAKAKKLFVQRTEVLESLVKSAEDAARVAGKTRSSRRSKRMPKYHRMTSPSLTAEPDCDKDSWPLGVPGEAFCKNFSTIHFPLELYEGDKRLRNAIKWTKGLDEVFKNNAEAVPDTKWQYFASKDGVFRRYPGANWPQKKSRNHELFDVRQQTWYERTVASPKDVVILVDVSGSVQGHSLQISKLAIKTLLNSLTEDDYFGVIKFSATPEVVGCWGESLIPATTPYKRAMFEAVDNLTTSGQADLNRAVEFACEFIRQFQNSRQSEEGAQCHKSVMLFTDGGIDWPQRAALKCSQVGVRLFTYAMGSNPVPTVAIKRLACESQGFFSSIHTMSAVRPRIIDSYLPVLSRPKAMSSANSIPEDISWTAGFTDPGGLGYSIAMTASVYNATEYDGKEIQELVGVVGVDVPWKEILEGVIPQRLNPLNYFFAVDQNGIVVYHPNLPDQPPLEQEPPNLDFLQFVGQTTRTVTVRKNLINARTAAVMTQLDSTLKAGDRYLLTGTHTFTYLALEPSPYKLALVSLGFPRVLENLEGFEPKEALKKLGEGGQSAVRLAPWPYCNKLDQPTRSNQEIVTDLESFKALVAKSEDGCDTIMASHVVFDLLKSEKVASSFWGGGIGDDEDAVALRFISTVGGLTRYSPANRGEDLRASTDPAKNDLLWRGIMNKGLLSVDLSGRGDYYEDSKKHGGKNKKRKTITFFKGVTFKRGSLTYPYGVVGVEFSENYIKDVFLKAVSSLPGSTGAPGLDDVATCIKGGPLDCYLLDDAGSVVASNQDTSPSGNGPVVSVGSFFGAIDPLGFDKLVEFEIYFAKEFYDYQGRCPKKPISTGASRRMLSPTTAILSFVKGFFEASFWNMVKTTIYGSIWTTDAAAVPHDFEIPKKAAPFQVHDPVSTFVREVEHACITREVRYLLNNEEGNSVADLFDMGLDEEEGDISAGWEVRCDNCTRRLKARKLADSRLVFVVAEPKCPCESREPAAAHWVPTESDGQHMCQREHQYRKRIHHCYPEHASETGSCDSSGSSISTLNFNAFLVCLVVFFGFASNN